MNYPLPNEPWKPVNIAEIPDLEAQLAAAKVRLNMAPLNHSMMARTTGLIITMKPVNLRLPLAGMWIHPEISFGISCDIATM